MGIDYWSKLEEGNCYHVYNRAISEESLFKEYDNYRYFLSKWDKCMSAYVQTLAYCLLPNHIHFLIRIRRVDKEMLREAMKQNTQRSQKFVEGEVNLNAYLEDQFKRLFSSYSLAFNRQQNRRGNLFQKRFKRVRILANKRLLDLICYIHFNAVNHGIVMTIDDWPHSSYREVIPI